MHYCIGLGGIMEHCWHAWQTMFGPVSPPATSQTLPAINQVFTWNLESIFAHSFVPSSPNTGLYVVLNISVTPSFRSSLEGPGVGAWCGFWCAIPLLRESLVVQVPCLTGLVKHMGPNTNSNHTPGMLIHGNQWGFRAQGGVFYTISLVVNNDHLLNARKQLRLWTLIPAAPMTWKISINYYGRV